MLTKVCLADEVVAYGQSVNRGYRVADGWGTIEEETYKEGWWMCPLDCTQKTPADNRIKDLKNRGYEIQQVIIAHEAPKLLCAPQEGEEKEVKVNRTKTTQYALSGVVSACGIAVLGVFVAYTLLTLLIPLIIGMAVVMMFGLGILVDPKAIVVLSDGSRVEVMSWIE